MRNENALQFQLSRVLIQCSGSYTVKNLEAGWCSVLILVRFDLRDIQTMVFLDVFDAQALIAKCRKRMAEINELKAC